MTDAACHCQCMTRLYCALLALACLAVAMTPLPV
jgi:hypothetical protein